MNKDVHLINEAYSSAVEYRTTRGDSGYFIKNNILSQLIKYKLIDKNNKHLFSFNKPIHIISELTGTFFLGILCLDTGNKLTIISKKNGDLEHSHSELLTNIPEIGNQCIKAWNEIIHELNEIGKSLHNKHKLNIDI